MLCLSLLPQRRLLLLRLSLLSQRRLLLLRALLLLRLRLLLLVLNSDLLHFCYSRPTGSPGEACANVTTTRSTSKMKLSYSEACGGNATTEIPSSAPCKPFTTAGMHRRVRPFWYVFKTARTMLMRVQSSHLLAIVQLLPRRSAQCAFRLRNGGSNGSDYIAHLLIN